MLWGRGKTDGEGRMGKTGWLYNTTRRVSTGSAHTAANGRAPDKLGLFW